MDNTTRPVGSQTRERAKEIYRRRISPQMEAENDNRYVVIDVDSEDLEIGDDFIEVVHRLRSRRPAARAFGLRVGNGGRPVDRFGAFDRAAFRPEGAP
jgi:hypothetical protein